MAGFDTSFFASQHPADEIPRDLMRPLYQARVALRRISQTKCSGNTISARALRRKVIAEILIVDEARTAMEQAVYSKDPRWLSEVATKCDTVRLHLCDTKRFMGVGAQLEFAYVRRMLTAAIDAAKARMYGARREVPI